jgi:hypothetical protein
MNGNNQFGAMVPIASFETAAPEVNFFFVNIPQTFQDLYLVIHGRATNSAATSNIYLNMGNTSGIDYGSNYSQTALAGNGSSAFSTRFSNVTGITPGSMPAATSTSGIFGATVLHFLNYANTSTFKTILSRTSFDLNGSGGTEARVFLWRSTAGLTTLQFGSDASFAAGSRMSLYGIRAVSS